MCVCRTSNVEEWSRSRFGELRMGPNWLFLHILNAVRSELRYLILFLTPWCGLINACVGDSILHHLATCCGIHHWLGELRMGPSLVSNHGTCRKIPAWVFSVISMHYHGCCCPSTATNYTHNKYNSLSSPPSKRPRWNLSHSWEYNCHCQPVCLVSSYWAQTVVSKFVAMLPATLSCY